MKALTAFLGGAVAGAVAALLFAPEKGETLREKIAETLRKYGCRSNEEDIDAIVEEISAQVEEEK